MGLFDALFPGKAYCAFCGYQNSSQARAVKTGEYTLHRSRTFGGMITKENPVMCPNCGLQMPLTDNQRMARANGEKHGFDPSYYASSKDGLVRDENGRPMGQAIGGSAIQSKRYLLDPSNWT